MSNFTWNSLKKRTKSTEYGSIAYIAEYFEAIVPLYNELSDENRRKISKTMFELTNLLVARIDLLRHNLNYSYFEPKVLEHVAIRSILIEKINKTFQKDDLNPISAKKLIQDRENYHKIDIFMYKDWDRIRKSVYSFLKSLTEQQ